MLYQLPSFFCCQQCAEAQPARTKFSHQPVLLVSEGPLYERGDLYDSLYGGPAGDIYQHDIYHEFRNSLVAGADCRSRL
jgi:hypothetical protein